jgi:hypothetical protein
VGEVPSTTKYPAEKWRDSQYVQFCAGAGLDTGEFDRQP